MASPPIAASADSFSRFRRLRIGRRRLRRRHWGLVSCGVCPAAGVEDHDRQVGGISRRRSHWERGVCALPSAACCRQCITCRGVPTMISVPAMTAVRPRATCVVSAVVKAGSRQDGRAEDLTVEHPPGSSTATLCIRCRIRSDRCCETSSTVSSPLSAASRPISAARSRARQLRGAKASDASALMLEAYGCASPAPGRRQIRTFVGQDCMSFTKTSSRGRAVPDCPCG